MRTKILLNYVLVIAILTLYGAQVCPFLASLSTLQLGLLLVVGLGLQYVLHGKLVALIRAKAPYPRQAPLVFATILGLFLGFGLLLAAFTTLAIGFPLPSGLKLTLGMAALGFFLAVDLTLDEEYALATHFLHTGKNLVQPQAHFFPLTKKFTWFASISAFFAIGVFFLIVNKDLDWMVHAGQEIGLGRARLLILVEVGFVVLVLLGYILKNIFSYARNLRLFFTHENRALSRATAGRLDSFVPVSSSDEFGIMASHTNHMIATLQQRNAELQRTQDVTIYTLTSMAETRDNETGAHILRTQRYVQCLAEALREHPRFATELDDAVIDLLFKSAPLHDIGKIGIPDAILLKPGKHTADEFEIMKTHAALGGEALWNAEKRLGSTSFLHIGREIAYTHHEKWDGSGYPHGLEGEDIPVSGRLMALADVYDALISERVYKPAFSHEKAKGIILDGKGKHFDPAVVDTFVAQETTFQYIAATFTDTAAQEPA